MPELLLLLKTRVVATVATLSQLLELWRVLSRSRGASSQSSPFSKSLTVVEAQETKDAVEVSWTTLSAT
jgi:hypothetical protein